jgi:protein SCO1/2
VVKVDVAHGSLIVSCDPIPNYMAAMEMPFKVREPKVLTSVQPGKTIRFTMVEREKVLYAENIREDTSLAFEPEPMEAGALTALHKALDPSAAAKIVPVGKPVPEFVLTDQAQNQIHLSQLQGKVVALTFGYSRCPNPNYCFRLSNNLATIAQRFQARKAHDLILLTIMIDPEHDKGAALTEYANVWKADPAVWHFLTGPLPEIQKVASMFGMNFWNDEGLLTHPLHTVVIDQQGQLVANVEGNQYTAKQLGDLVETVMDSPAGTTESKFTQSAP